MQDACYFQDRLVLIDEAGLVYITEVVPTTDGFKLQRIDVETNDNGLLANVNATKVFSGQQHLVVVDRFRKAWSHGQGPQTGLIRPTATKKSGKRPASAVRLSRIEFFQGHDVVALAAGRDFNLAIVHREDEVEAAVGGGHTKAAATAVTTVNSPNLSSKSSCPLGLPLQQNAAATPLPVTASGDNFVDEDSSGSPLDEGIGQALFLSKMLVVFKHCRLSMHFWGHL